MRKEMVVCGLLASLLGGCGDNNLPPVDQQYVAGSETLSVVPAGEDHPPAIASIAVGEDSTVEFYDYGDRALTIERGVAGGAPPVLRGALEDLAREPGRLVDLFTALRPDLPVPDKLRELDQRLQSAQPPSPSANPPQMPSIEGGFDPQPEGPMPQPLSAGPGVTPQSPQGCNNGCCDPDWLPTICENGGQNGWDINQPHWIWNWYVWNWGYGTAISGDPIHQWGGTVCSASGTSTWSASTHADWLIEQAHFIRYNWTCNFACTSTAHSQVNSSSNQHLHMHCGWFNYTTYH